MLELAARQTCQIVVQVHWCTCMCIISVSEHLVTGKDLTVISYNFLGLFFTQLFLCFFFLKFSLLL